MSRHSGSVSARLVAVALCGGLLAGCQAPSLQSAGFNETLQHGYVIDERAVSEVRPGLAPERVLQLLGTPSTVSTVGNKSWYYISQTTVRRVQFLGQNESERRVLAVYFTPGFKVERVAIYGLEEGRVFDFISRTTPSGGSDQNFLSQLFRGLGTFIPNS